MRIFKIDRSNTSWADYGVFKLEHCVFGLYRWIEVCSSNYMSLCQREIEKLKRRDRESHDLPVYHFMEDK